MKTVAIIAVALALAGCGKSDVEKAYDALIEEAKAHCVGKGGDEFKPYGSLSWYRMFTLQKPTTFSCVRLGKFYNRRVAVYALRVDAGQLTWGIR